MKIESPSTEALGCGAPIASLDSSDPTKRERARRELEQMGSAAVIPLIDALKCTSSRVCWEAAKALAAIKDPAAANALADALDHDDHSVRWTAADALIALGAEGLKQTLVTLLTNARSYPLREAARHVISHFAHRFSGESLRPLLARFNAYEPAVALPPAALRVLHEMERETEIARTPEGLHS